VAIVEAVKQAVSFIRDNGIERLNVAGPRASGEQSGYAYAFELVSRMLQALPEPKTR
jgi:hypothetical protein